MPIYRIYGKRGAERRSRRLHTRMRWAALLLSAAMLALAAAMLMHGH